MNVIFENAQWGNASVYTWGELEVHQWDCFRLALNESETETKAQGVVLHRSGVLLETETEMKAQGAKVDFSPVVFNQTTEMVVNIIVSDRDYKTDMIKMLPKYEKKSTVFNEILTAYDREFRNVEQRLEVAKRNIFIDTAVEALPIYERDLGIESINTLDYQQRREQIFARNRASFDQTTEETIKEVAAAYSNGEVELNTTQTVGVYEIKFVGSVGIPNNIEGLKKALDVIFPAHLGLTYNYSFNTWDSIKGNTWNDASSHTWKEMREEVL